MKDIELSDLIDSVFLYTEWDESSGWCIVNYSQ